MPDGWISFAKFCRDADRARATVLEVAAQLGIRLELQPGLTERYGSEHKTLAIREEDAKRVMDALSMLQRRKSLRRAALAELGGVRSSKPPPAAAPLGSPGQEEAEEQIKEYMRAMGIHYLERRGRTLILRRRKP